MGKKIIEETRREKKAQTSVIAVILIVLISIVSLLIVWNVVFPLLKEKSREAGEIEKVLGVNLEVKEVILFVTGASRVAVTRKAGKGEIDGMKFIFYDEEGNSHAETKEGVLEELETKTYYFSPVGMKIKSVSVVPFVGEGIGLSSETKTSKILEIPAGLVSWWRFDDSNDFIGENNCGFVEIVEDSKRGKVANFNKLSVECGKTDLSIVDKGAISFWLKTSGEGEIIKKGAGANYKVSLKQGKIEFSYISNGELKSGESVSEVDDEEWHHIVVSEDWSGNKNLMIYIDGKLDKIILMPDLPETNEETILIGNFQGKIDELMFFNKALSKPEVESLFSGQK